jgi:hypothetical protein
MSLFGGDEIDIYDTNLEMLWDLATNNIEFTFEDRLNILTAYFGKEEAEALYIKNQSPPCYQDGLCSHCKYFKYCENKNLKRNAELDVKQGLKSISRILSDYKSRKLQ